MENKYKEEKKFMLKVAKQILRPAIKKVAKHLEDYGYKPNVVSMISIRGKFKPSTEILHSTDIDDIMYLILFKTFHNKAMMAKLAKKDQYSYLKLKDNMRVVVIRV